jgi:hypothetical protein
MPRNAGRFGMGHVTFNAWLNEQNIVLRECEIASSWRFVEALRVHPLNFNFGS